MNIQEYMGTGILEQYCLSILPNDQAREVEALRSQYPEIGAEGNKERGPSRVPSYTLSVS